MTRGPEVPVASEERREGEPKRIARAVIVAPIPVSDFRAKLIELGLNQIDQLPFAEVMMIKKSEESDISAGLVMPAGGELDFGETAEDGVLRQVSEEVTVTSFSERSARERWRANPSNGYAYAIQSYATPRRVELYTLPVQSRTVSMHKPRETKDRDMYGDKIEKVVQFTTDQFEELVGGGSAVTRRGESVRAAGVITWAGDGNINIDDENGQIKNKELERVLAEVNDFEETLRFLTLEEINSLRRIRRIPLAENLFDCDFDEITRGFVGAQLRMALHDDYEDEKPEGPHKKMSLLRALPYLASSLPGRETINLLYSMPNRENIQAAIRMERAFVKGAGKIFEGVGVDPPENGRAHVVFSRESISQKLIEIWPRFLKLAPVDRIKLMDEAEKAAIGEIMHTTGAQAEDVSEALRAAAAFNGEITKEIKVGGIEAFQEFRSMNELSKVRIFKSMAHSLGLHPNVAVDDDTSEVMRTLRLEAQRSLAYFNVAVEAAKKIREARNDLFQASLDSFFVFPPETEKLDFGGGRSHSVYHRQTRIAVGGRNLHLVVDEREKKTTISAARKMFLDPRLDDIFSTNFVLADDNFSESSDPAGDRLNAVIDFREALIAHIGSTLGDGWEVGIDEETHKRIADKLSSELSEDSASEKQVAVGKGGKRAGSKGDAILREKFALYIRGPEGVEERIEINIYPFQSVEAVGLEDLKSRGYWGFVEKLLDDYTGIYNAERILSRDPREPTKPSLYELLYPRRFYKPQAEKVKTRHVKKRTKV